MGKRTDRRSSPAPPPDKPHTPTPGESKAFEIINKGAKPPSSETHAEQTATAQAVVDNLHEKSEALSPQDPGLSRRADRIVAEATAGRAEDPAFMDLYAKSSQRGVGRLRSITGLPGSWPPNAIKHPVLGLPALRYCGKTIVLRWIGTYAVYRQKRYEQGWIYFEGPEWAERLGLNYEAYRNEKGRIQRGDSELAWMAEDVAIAKETQRRADRGQMNDQIKDAFAASMDNNPYVRDFHVYEGSDEEVNDELHERKRFAGARS